MSKGDLADRIAAAFYTDSPPPERIVVHRCGECERLSLDFADKKWTELSQDVLEHHHDSIPLLSPEAFAYYLPAYLLFAAKEPNRMGEMLLYSLGPKADEWAAGRREACKYSVDQLRLIIEVAEMIAAEDIGHFGRFLRRAREYWT